METLVLVIMTIVCLSFVLKQTFMKPWAVVLYAVLCAVFIGVMWDVAAEQSKAQIREWLGNPRLMLDTSAVMTVEVMIQTAYCILSAHLMTTGGVRRRMLWIYRLLRFFPGLLVFPVLFHLEAVAMFTFTGMSFRMIAYSLAAVVAVAVFLCVMAVKWLLPEKDIRLEILFFLNVLLLLLGIIATVNGSTAVAGVSSVDWTALAGVLTLIILFGVIGIIKQLINNKS